MQNSTPFPIIDLHCDLLYYLQREASRTPFDSLSRASYPQMRQGHVAMQTLAIYAGSSKEESLKTKKQVSLFLELLSKYEQNFTLFDPKNSPLQEQVSCIAAIENAGGIIEEDLPIEQGLKELDHLRKLLKKILYISLTWDGENRFGGGVGAKVGLKTDGKKVLDWMDKKQIAIDLSHCSDFLAHDIFNHIDKQSLQIPVLASHSNFRFITPRERNLPDEFALEIIRRKGLIGINFFKAFIGENKFQNITKHIEYGLKIGGVHSLCFGADFFCDHDSMGLEQKYGNEAGFFAEMGDSSCYPRTLELLQEKLSLPDAILEGIAYKNAKNFCEELYKDTACS